MGGFFGQLASAYGQNIIEGQKNDLRVAEVQEEQQKAAMGKMQLMQAQQKQKTTRDISDYMNAAQAKDKSTVDDPAKTAKMYEGAEAIAIRGGNFQGAEELSNLAKGKRKESEDAKSQVLNQISQAKEDLSQSALDYSANPTNEGAKELALKAVKAGSNPSTIPAPGTPAWSAWVTKQGTASMSVKEQQDFSEKQREFNQKTEIAKQNHADEQANQMAQRQQTASLQAGLREDKREQRAQDKLDVLTQDKKEKEKLDEKRRYDEQKQTGSQRQAVDAEYKATGLAVNAMKNVMNQSSSANQGMFSQLKEGTFLSAIEKTGTRTLTSDQPKLYNTAMAGLALNTARAETLGGGKGANESTIKEFNDAIKVQAGDTENVAKYKLAVAAQAMRTSMDRTRDSTSEKVMSAAKGDRAFLESIPTVEAVQAQINKSMSRKDQNAMQTLGQKLSAVVGKPDTVAKDKSAYPDDISAILNAHPGK